MKTKEQNAHGVPTCLINGSMDLATWPMHELLTGTVRKATTCTMAKSGLSLHVIFENSCDPNNQSSCQKGLDMLQWRTDCKPTKSHSNQTHSSCTGLYQACTVVICSVCGQFWPTCLALFLWFACLFLFFHQTSKEFNNKHINYYPNGQVGN